MDTNDDVISRIEQEWSSSDGFFYYLRQGLFDPPSYDRLMRLLASFSELDEDAVLPRRLISLLWYIPSFMMWQRERVAEAGGDVSSLDKAATLIHNELERILGVP
jgi:hypothetical protein